MVTHTRTHTRSHAHKHALMGLPSLGFRGKNLYFSSQVGEKREYPLLKNCATPTKGCQAFWAGMTGELMTLLTGAVSKPSWPPQGLAAPWTKNVWCSVLKLSAVSWNSPFWYWALFTSCYTTVDGTSVLCQ